MKGKRPDCDIWKSWGSDFAKKNIDEPRGIKSTIKSIKHSKCELKAMYEWTVRRIIWDSYLLNL